MSPIERTPGGGASAGGLVKLFDSTLGAPAANIDTGANGIAAGHSVLEIWAFGRTDEAVILSGVGLRFNNDSGANYDRATMASSTASTTPLVVDSPGETDVSLILAGASCAANVAGLIRVTIPGYDQTTFFKVIEATSEVVDTVAGLTHRGFQLQVNNWRSTAAITQVTMIVETAGKNLLAGSRLVIYGTQ